MAPYVDSLLQSAWLADAASGSPPAGPATENPSGLWLFLVATGVFAIYVWGQAAHAARPREDSPSSSTAEVKGKSPEMPKRRLVLPNWLASVMGGRPTSLPRPSHPASAGGVPPSTGRLPVLACPATAHDLAALAEVIGSRWEEVVAATLFAAQERCEACDAEADLKVLPLWRFDEDRRLQSPRGLIALCELCAEASEDLELRREQTTVRFAHVNGWSREITRAVMSKAQRDRESRAQGPWSLDMESPLVSGLSHAASKSGP